MPRRARWYIGMLVMSSVPSPFDHQHAARIRTDQPDDHVERSGLARAVRPQQAHHFALLHPQRHVVHHLAAAIDFGDLDVLRVFIAGRSCLRRTLLAGSFGTPFTSSLSSLENQVNFAPLVVPRMLSANCGLPPSRITLSSSTIIFGVFRGAVAGAAGQRFARPPLCRPRTRDRAKNRRCRPAGTPEFLAPSLAY